MKTIYIWHEDKRYDVIGYIRIGDSFILWEQSGMIDYQQTTSSYVSRDYYRICDNPDIKRIYDLIDKYL